MGIEAFAKSIKHKRVSSLLDGFISGFILGIITVLVVVSREFEVPIPAEYVTFMLIAVIVSVAIFVWGVHRAITTKEE